MKALEEMLGKLLTEEGWARVVLSIRDKEKKTGLSFMKPGYVERAEKIAERFKEKGYLEQGSEELYRLWRDALSYVVEKIKKDAPELFYLHPDVAISRFNELREKLQSPELDYIRKLIKGSRYSSNIHEAMKEIAEGREPKTFVSSREGVHIVDSLKMIKTPLEERAWNILSALEGDNVFDSSSLYDAALRYCERQGEFRTASGIASLREKDRTENYHIISLFYCKDKDF